MTNQARHLYLKRIALLALMLALTIIFCFVPISFGTVTLALMILPTLILAQVSNFSTTLTLALLMGIVNYIAWFTTKAGTPLAPIFQNPLVCILPRVLIGVVAYFVRIGLEKLLLKNVAKNEEKHEQIINDDDDDFDAIKADLSGENNGEILGENIVVNDGEISLESATQNDNLQDESVVDNLSDEVANDNANINVDTSKATKKEHEPYQQKALKDMSKKEVLLRQIITVVSTAMGVITNTLFVAIFTLIFFNGTSIGQNTVISVNYILAWFGLNFGVEVVSFSLITPPIVLALKASRLA